MSKKAQLGESAILSSLKSKKSIARWRKKTTSDENEDDDDDEDDDEDDNELSSSSSSASSLWSPKPKVLYTPSKEIDLELDAAYYQKSIGGSFRLSTTKSPMNRSDNNSATEKNSNNKNNDNANHVDFHECLIAHRRQALTKDDIDAVVSGSRLDSSHRRAGRDHDFNLSVAVNSRSNMFRSLKYKAKSGFKHALNYSERRPAANSISKHNDHLKDEIRCNNGNNSKRNSSLKNDEKKNFEDIDIHVDEVSNKDVIG